MKRMIFLMLILLVWSTASMNAQVRIGGLDDPHQSAVLDLNEDDEANEGNLGFALPRVFLREKNQKLNNAKPADGTVIYNTNSDYARGRGIYFWTDSLWVRAASYTLREGDTIRVLEKPVIKVVEPQPAEGIGVQFTIDGSYPDNGSVYRYEWTVLSSYPLVDPLPTPTSQTSKMDLITVPFPFDDIERTYEVKARAIADGYNDPKEESDPVWSTIPGKFKPEFRMTGQDFYDIAVTNYTNPTQYGRWAYREEHRLDVNKVYTYEIVGSELENLNYTWSVVDNNNNILANTSSINGASTPFVNLQFADLSDNGTIKETPGTKLSATLRCEVRIDDGSFYTEIFEKEISVGDYDVCSWGIGLKDSEENSYTISRFGDVCWMTQNLRSTKTNQNGAEVTVIESINAGNSNTDPFYHYPNGNTSILSIDSRYGLLYSWAAANVGSADASDAFPNQTSTRQGICPKGWVIPSDWDWSNLEKEIATNPGLYSSQNAPFPGDAGYNFYTSIGWRPDEDITDTSWGRQMKADGVNHTTNKVNNADPKGSSNNDGSGFNALLVGSMYTGAPDRYGTVTIFWSSSSSNSSTAWRRTLHSSYSGAVRNTGYKYNLYSVRCKKNDN